jgi:hypothetical protein
MLEDNIKTNLTEIRMGWYGLYYLAEDRGHWMDLVNTVINLWAPLNVGNL